MARNVSELQSNGSARAIAQFGRMNLIVGFWLPVCVLRGNWGWISQKS
jgi:hypothetical protein